MSFLFGDSGSDPQPFRGPGWEQQGQTLNDLFMGQLYGSNPQLMEGWKNQLSSLQQQLGNTSQGGVPAGMPGIFAQSGNFGANPQYSNIQNQISALQGKIGMASAFPNRSFTPGQEIAGQMGATTNAADFSSAIPVQWANRTAATFTNPMQAFNFTDPTKGMTAQQMVGDAFTPQYEMAQRLAQREGQQQQKDLTDSMARRGLLASGVTNQALQLQQRDQGDRLANLSSQLAAQQGQQMLGANQYLQGMGWNQQQAQAQEAARSQQGEWARQTAQAEEMFRQQGATDAQAQFMANMALQQRQQQLGAQQQQWGQQMGGRQQSMGEWQLGNQTQRQPMEDLFRLYQLSTGGNPGSPGTPGLLQGLAGGVGQGLGTAAGIGLMGMFCLPKGTPIETEDGTMPVDQIRPGDIVKGGTVIRMSMAKRPSGHRFYRHKLSDGTVIMSLGHPYFGTLLEDAEPTDEDSDFTYDIMTTEGHYFVNGAKLGSTL